MVFEILQALLFLLASALIFIHRLEFFQSPPLTFLNFQPSLIFEIIDRHPVDKEILELVFDTL